MTVRLKSGANFILMLLVKVDSKILSNYMHSKLLKKILKAYLILV